jgi:hypothetical protein
MLAASYGTVGDIEIMWCLIALVGLVFSVFTANKAIGDRKALKLLGIGNGRKSIASYAIFAEVGRAAIQFIFLSIGITSLFLPQYDESQLPTAQLLAGILVRWGLILSSLILTSKSYAAYRLRKRLVGD